MTVWYCSPTGTGNGATRTAPMSLIAAISSGSPAKPGDTISLKSGTYVAPPGGYIVQVAGTPDKPLKIRRLSGATVVLDGKNVTADAVIRAETPDVWYWGFEITNTNPQRWTDETGSNPRSLFRASGINVYGDRVKVINVVTHEGTNGLGLWSQSDDTEVHGCVIYNNGWAAPDRGHGHGMYIQNATGIKRFDQVISIGNYSTGMKGFGYAGSAIGLRFTDIISANNGAPVNPAGPGRADNLFMGSDAGVNDVVIQRLLAYQPAGCNGGGVTLGWGSTIGDKVSLLDSTISCGAQAVAWNLIKQPTMRGCTIHSTRPRGAVNNELVRMTPPSGMVAAIDGNTYIDDTNGYPFSYTGAKNAMGGGMLAWSDWQGIGLDKTSTLRRGVLDRNVVVVHRNRYEAGRANIGVLNWENLTTTRIDPAQIGLSPTRRWQLRLAQGFHLGPVLTGTGPINIPLDRKPAPPVGTTVDVSTPQFHAFVVLPAT